ncbi:uncharacterized protein LOC121869015 [Homarus americanus]|uniref:uncharacterized protein LOC121869015 n=1 Tax=Homarus americanus TaxID=6706 RepID=UPI001C43BE25|nr:uncharacterized protein LOC121869015 [Homarus americanus]
MEGTRHPHQAIPPMSTVSSWQQQQYQQSAQQYQEPRLGQPYDQPRLGQQYQQPRIQSQYQQPQFGQQQHHLGLGQQYQQSGLLPLPQQLGLGQYHQHPGFGRQHQQPRLMHPRPSEPFPEIFPHLQKQQESQLSYDDKQHDHASHRVDVHGQQRSMSPDPQQQKDAEIMSLWKDMQEGNKKTQDLMHSSLDVCQNEEVMQASEAEAEAEVSTFPQNTLKETEPIKVVHLQERPGETTYNIPVGLHCSSAPIEGVDITNNTSMVPLELTVRNMIPLPTSSSGLVTKPLSPKISHPLSSPHDFTRYDFTDITKLSGGMPTQTHRQPGTAAANDYSPTVETTLCDESRPFIQQKYADLCGDSNPARDPLDTTACDDSTSSDNRQDSAVPDDSNLSDERLDCAARDYSYPSDDQPLDCAVRADSNPSVDLPESVACDDSTPSIEPLASVVRDDSNPSVDQLESTLCSTSAYLVGPSKGHSRSAFSDDSNPSNDHRRPVLHTDANQPHRQEVTMSVGRSSPSSDQLEPVLPGNSSFANSLSKSVSRPDYFINSSLSSDQPETHISDYSCFAEGPPEDDTASALRDASDLSGQPEVAVENESSTSPSDDQIGTAVSGDSNQCDSGPKSVLQENSNSCENECRNSVQEDDYSNSSHSLPKICVREVCDSDSSEYLPKSAVKENFESNSLNHQPKISKQEGSKSNSSEHLPKILAQESFKSNLPGNLTQTSAQESLESNFPDHLPKYSPLRSSKCNSSDKVPKASLQNTNESDLSDNNNKVSASDNIEPDSSSDSVTETSAQEGIEHLLSGTGIGLPDGYSVSDKPPRAGLSDKLSGSQPRTSHSPLVPTPPDGESGILVCDDSNLSHSWPRIAILDESSPSGNQKRTLPCNDSSLSDGQATVKLPMNLSSPVKSLVEQPRPTSLSIGHSANSLSNSEQNTTLTDTLGDLSGSESAASINGKNSDEQQPALISEPECVVQTPASNPVHDPLPEHTDDTSVNTLPKSPGTTVGDFHFVEVKGISIKVSPKRYYEPISSDASNIPETKSVLPFVFPEDSARESDDDMQVSVGISVDARDLHIEDAVNTINQGDTQDLPTNNNDEDQGIIISEESDVQEEGYLSNDSDTDNFLEEDTVYICEKPTEATCNVCESNVKSAHFKSHLFFGHIQCIHCNRRLVGCDMLQDLKDPKKDACKKSPSEKHSFKIWTLDPIEFLAYYIRKELVIKRFCAGLNGPPTAPEIVDEIGCYVAKLVSLKTLAPWKTAIAKCNKYVNERKPGGKKYQSQNISTPTIVSASRVTRSSQPPADLGKSAAVPIKQPSAGKPAAVSVKQPSTCISAAVPIKLPSTDIPATVPIKQPSTSSVVQHTAVSTSSSLREKRSKSTKVSSSSAAAVEPSSTQTPTPPRSDLKKTPIAKKKKLRQSGKIFLKYLGAGLKKSGKFDVTPPPQKKQTKPLNVCDLKNIVVQAPVDGNYLVVNYPSQHCPDNCPNCYCRFDPSAITVHCFTSVITNKCMNCDLTIFVVQDPPDGSIQNIKFQNKRKMSHKFSGPQSKKRRKQ